MKLVYTAGILAALSLAACSKTSDTAPPPAASASPHADAFGPLTGPRRKTPLADVSTLLTPLLPKHGMYAQGGGSAKPPWRAVVDLSAGTITTARSANVGLLPSGELEKTSTRPITDAERAELTSIAEHAWREPMPVLVNPRSDYDEVLVLTDGTDAFYLDAYGEMRPPAAAALVGKLRAIALTP